MSAEATASSVATRQALDRVADALYAEINKNLPVERFVCERLAAVAIRALLSQPTQDENEIIRRCAAVADCGCDDCAGPQHVLRLLR